MVQCTISDEMSREFQNSGFILYKICNKRTRNVIDHIKWCGILDCNANNEEEPVPCKLVEKTMKLNAAETVTEKRDEKVTTLEWKVSMGMKRWKTWREYANQFPRLTANYSWRIRQTDHSSGCQMIFIMIQNTLLPPMVRSSLVLQLSGSTKRDENPRVK